jgi:hypothetical protein
MRFMMLMIPGGYSDAKQGTMPDPKAVAEMMKYNKSLEEAGVLISLDGLHHPSMGARVTFSKGIPSVINGPFPDIKETLGGYWMINVNSKDDAIKWAKLCPAGDNEIIEIRQVQEYLDFTEDIQKVINGV